MTDVMFEPGGKEEQDLLRKAKLRCMNLLKSLDKTEWELRRKLSDGGYPDGVTDAAIAWLKANRYLDDMRYACNYIESRSRDRGLRRIEQELLGRGIAKDVVSEAISRAEAEDERQVVRRLAEKKGMELTAPTAEQLRKYYGFFLRRGFSYDAIREIWSGCKSEQDMEMS